ncbi:hypothetical protein IF2G_00583 [Cordyceps javanica]|nr:hypothetical protein IF2G_00583 [Cordyceps javanica]
MHGRKVKCKSKSKSKDDDTVAAAALLLPGVMYIYMLHAANHLDDQVSFVLEATLEACLCPPPRCIYKKKKGPLGLGFGVCAVCCLALQVRRAE